MKFVKKLLEKIKSWLRSIFNKSTKCETPRNDNPSSNEPEEIAPDMNEDSNPQTKEETLEPEVNKEETVVPEVKNEETPEPETTTEYVDEDGFLHIGTTEADFIKHYAHDLFLGRQCRMINDNHGKFSDFTPDPNGKYRMFYITNDELIRSGACTRNSDGSLRPKRNGLLDKGWEDGISNSKVEYVKNMSWDELVSFMRENDIRYEYVIFDEHAMLYDVDPKLIFDNAPESVVTKEESDTTTEFVDEEGFLHIGDNEADFVKRHSRKLFLCKDRIKATTTPNPDATYRIFSIANNELLNNGAYMMDSKGMLHSKKHNGNDKGWANGIINSKVDYANNMSWSELVTFMRVNKIKYEYLIFDENGILYDIDPKLIFNYD